jgi:hypothetical protein
LRSAPLFASTVNCTVPFPVPVDPEVTRTHDWDAVADQSQDDPAVTVKEPAPPLAPKGWLVGLMVKEQPPAC